MKPPLGSEGPSQLHNTSLKTARKILGYFNVFPEKHVARVFRRTGVPRCPIRYSLETLAQCAKENRQGECWVLICRLSLSPYEIYRILPKYFMPVSMWEETLPGREWVRYPGGYGYRLINLKPAYVGARDVFGPNHPMALQKDVLAWANTSTVIQGMIAVYALNRRRVMQKTYHICRESRQKEIALIGEFVKEGMLFYHMPMDVAGIGVPDAGVVMCRIPNT